MNIDSDFSLKFDNYDIKNIPNLVLLSRKPNSMPDRELKTVSLVRNDGSVVVSDRLVKKVIEVYAIIIAPSRQAYEETIDELKWRLSQPQRPLQLAQAGRDRVYTASLDNMAETFVEGGNSFITMYFVCHDPYGRDTSTVTYISDPYTVATQTFDHVYQGRAPVKPVLVVTLTAVSGGTAQSITIGNGVSTQSITITGDFVTGDVVRIDCASQDVRVNGVVPTDWTGFFPTFDPNTAYTKVSDTFTTRTAELRIEYSPRYT